MDGEGKKGGGPSRDPDGGDEPSSSGQQQDSGSPESVPTAASSTAPAGRPPLTGPSGPGIGLDLGRSRGPGHLSSVMEVECQGVDQGGRPLDLCDPVTSKY